jgi:endonuclease YncB( thermonuclease family)
MDGIAASLLCLVVGISDGDTLTVRCGDQPQQRIRLMEIDAPEKAQAYGQKAKQALSALVYGQQIDVEVSGSDRYRRTLAHLKLDDVDINRVMVRQGFAWCYRQYLRDRSCLDDEARAKAQHLGLWADPDPTPPWEWRRAKRK